jgi:antitoxin FitA
MATLYVRNIPDELYEHLQQLAKAENRSINAQVITLLQNALLVKTQQPQEKTQEDVLKLLEESRRRRESLPTDIEWLDSTAMIREDRDR